MRQSDLLDGFVGFISSSTNKIEISERPGQENLHRVPGWKGLQGSSSPVLAVQAGMHWKGKILYLQYLQWQLCQITG